MNAKEYNNGVACGVDGLTTLLSDLGPKQTMDRLEVEIHGLGMRIFATINHAALAELANLQLRPTELIVFGNPSAGTPLMQANQTIGIDLPLKMLVWQDASGKTWLTYNDSCWLVNRHGRGVNIERNVDMMSLELKAIAKKVTEH